MVITRRLRQHALINALDAVELAQILSSMLDRGSIRIGRQRIRGSQLRAVELELLSRKRSTIIINLMSIGPLFEQRGSKKVGRALVRIRGCDEICFQRLVRTTEFVGAAHGCGQLPEALQHRKLYGMQQQLVESDKV